MGSGEQPRPQPWRSRTLDTRCAPRLQHRWAPPALAYGTPGCRPPPLAAACACRRPLPEGRPQPFILCALPSAQMQPKASPFAAAEVGGSWQLVPPAEAAPQHTQQVGASGWPQPQSPAVSLDSLTPLASPLIAAASPASAVRVPQNHIAFGSGFDACNELVRRAEVGCGGCCTTVACVRAFAWGGR